jgi:hypothetical protein
VNNDDQYPSPGSHRLRGIVFAVVLGPLAMFFGINASLALVDQFVAGWTPSSWFSSDAVDWLFAGGIEGGAGNYVVFMINGVLSSLCITAIRWAFTGRTD